LLENMFLFAVTPIFILLLYKRCTEGLAAAATKHLELHKQKDEAESSFIIENIVGKLLNRTLDLIHFIYPLQDSNR
jgi:hypothetical protein